MKQTKNYEEVLYDTIYVCSKKWAHRGDYNWITAMYIDWENNYLNRSTFIEIEVAPLMFCFKYDIMEETHRDRAVNALIDLFRNIGLTNPHRTNSDIGEIALKIIKGGF